MSALSLFVIPVASTSDYFDYNAMTNTFTVYPSGGDDTTNIQAAFNAAVVAGPGSTVKLTAGQFYCTNIIVKDFYGTFTGAGKDHTFIDTLQALDPTAPPIKKVCTEETGELDPTLFVFVRGDITVSDLTFDITPYAPGEPFLQWGVWYTTLYFTVVIVGETANSRFDNVRFEGHQGSEEWLGSTWNVHAGPVVTGGIQKVFIDGVEAYWSFVPTSGKHVVVNCQFEHLEGGVISAGLTDGTLEVGGSPATGNTFNDMGVALVTNDQENSNIEFSFNDLSNIRGAGVQVWQAKKPQSTPFPINYISEPSHYLISHNTIHCIYVGDGIVLLDTNFLDSGQKSIDALISYNDIILDTFWGGVFGYGTQDVVVRNNRIRGTGIAAIYLGAWGDPCSNWLILGNNVEHVDAWIAPIWLGPGSSGCIVIGGSTKAIVFDEGTDNLIVGVNNMDGISPGKTLADALAEKMALISRFR
jgi:hypothetical protein